MQVKLKKKKDEAGILAILSNFPPKYYSILSHLLILNYKSSQCFLLGSWGQYKSYQSAWIFTLGEESW